MQRAMQRKRFANNQQGIRKTNENKTNFNQTHERVEVQTSYHRLIIANE
jgi:hypothetical protein